VGLDGAQLAVDGGQLDGVGDEAEADRGEVVPAVGAHRRGEAFGRGPLEEEVLAIEPGAAPLEQEVEARDSSSFETQRLPSVAPAAPDSEPESREEYTAPSAVLPAAALDWDDAKGKAVEVIAAPVPEARPALKARSAVRIGPALVT